MAIRNLRTGEVLQVHPYCLMFFIDETGHEDFADAAFSGIWRGRLRVAGGRDRRDLAPTVAGDEGPQFWWGGRFVAREHSPSKRRAQIAAIGQFFKTQEFGRFAVTMTRETKFPPGVKPIRAMPGILRRRWEQLTPRFHPLPVEVAFIHEAACHRGSPNRLGHSLSCAVIVARSLGGCPCRLA